MKASEILHGLAELLAGIEGRQPQEPETNQSPMVSKFTPQNQEPEGAQQAGMFVPPLQAKLELLKKAVNVDSVYDQTGEDSDLSGHGMDNEDELARIKKMAGIHPVVADEAAGTDPMDV